MRRRSYLSVGFILEEGMPLDELGAIATTMGRRRAGRPASRSSPATPRWSTPATATGVYINTAGIGLVPAGVDLGPHRVAAG